MSHDSNNTIWQVFNLINLAVIVYDNKTHNYILNQHAKTLLNINSDDALSSDVFNNITLRDFNDDTVVTVEQLFTSTLTAVLLECEFTPQLLNVNYSIIDDSVSMITLEQDHSHAEQYNFDHIISKISTKLIDIQNDNIDQQINFALKAIGTVCKADRSYLFEFNTDSETLTNTHEWVNTGITAYKDRLQNVPKAELPYFFDVMNLTHLFKVNDVAQLPPEANSEKAEFEAQSIQSVLCVGLRFDKELVGFIGCDCVNTKRQWSKIDLIRIKLVGEIINNALKNINYKKKLQLAQKQLINANTKLNKLANTDALTDIANRRFFDTSLKSEIKRSARQHQPISLIMCDIDFFKRYNDNYGHHKGDETLKHVARALKSLCKREGDIAARYGGEEFAIILPATNIEQCHKFALLIEQKIKALNITHEFSPIAPYITLSFGCFCSYPNADTHTETLIKSADIALYKAKKAGRNQICIFE
ncbi:MULTISPECIES: diguanylate cyclase [Pseudoalteromonas]|uniref:diguanylate cyclase n=1 Tax=Pseudoalteromonas tetraodonis TaxID=43659 RepID=A0ABD4EU80_9GAMM|nr:MULTISPECIES: diguanylate cyclase [Pseudoalteromonas]MAY59525.1 GGDEF domain-containing protein [Pseudoalteromonas sp.]KYL37082.1 diguanylate cyclase [Pseudoalteromonas spiralis]MDN3407037.1 diguanylate cyclase [Pseudoalteromonas sp. APC 3218]MDN3408636.1 diguanylate cyclase [Pseudoalteromonas sp. APC 3894]MDN3416041.1 diguanylate cyclase [Pseudoalteromonas sp. APC 3227]